MHSIKRFCLQAIGRNVVLLAGLCVGLGAAHAQAPSLTADNPAGAVGQKLYSLLSFEVGAAYPFGGLTVDLGFDPGRLSFAGEAPTFVVNGTTHDGATLPFFTLNDSTPGSLTFAWSVFPEITADGTIVVKTAFIPASAGATAVSYTASIFGQDEANFSGSFTVTAVPEPETWLLWLGGLGALAAAARRRARA